MFEPETDGRIAGSATTRRCPAAVCFRALGLPPAPADHDLTPCCRRIDVTAAPGPFVAVQLGSPADAVVEATLLRSTGLSVEFDSRPRSTVDTRALKSFELVRVSMPARWWAARFTASATTVDGAMPGKVGDFASIVGELRYAGQNKVLASSRVSHISSAFDNDNTMAGGRVIMNAALNTIGSQQEPLAGVNNPAFISTPTGSSPSGFPLYDNRFTSVRPVYVLMCRRAGCAQTSSSVGLNRVTVALKLVSVESIPGECDSAASCAPGPDGHPAQTRASGFSANGDVRRFDKCMLFAGRSGRTAETRCVECTSDCDCNPGQFCYRYTGLSGDADGRLMVVDELSRLRAGTCMKKDMNDTQLGKPCRRTSFSSPRVYYTASPMSTFGTSNTPFLKDQAGAVQCGESVFYTADQPSAVANPLVNTTGQSIGSLWSGTCDAEGMCRECTPGTSSTVSTLCLGHQVCLDGRAFRTLSVDQTIRSFTNDTRAGTLLTVVFLLLIVCFVVVWTFVAACIAARRTGPAKDADDTTTNPAFVSRRASALKSPLAAGSKPTGPKATAPKEEP